jgi:N-acetylneuraminic acid mutarotase
VQREVIGKGTIMCHVLALFLALVASTAGAHAQPQPDKARGLCGWRELAPVAGGPRQEHGVVALKGKVYVIAGVNPTNTGRVEAYDPRRNTWAEVAPLPLPMNHPNVAAVRGRIYVLGGLVGAGPWTAVGNIFEYDPQRDRWSQIGFMPAGTERGSAAVGVRGTRIYLAGGLRSLTPGPGGFQDTVATFSSYDVARGTWQSLPNLPEPRDHVGGAVVGGTFYALGGRANGVENVKNTVFAYSLSAGTWSRRSPLPTPRGGVAAAVIGATIFVLGGEGNPDPDSHGVYDDNEAYDTANDAWRVLPPMPTPLHGTGAAVVGSTIYVPGGAPRTRLAPTDLHEAFKPC